MTSCVAHPCGSDNAEATPAVVPPSAVLIRSWLFAVRVTATVSTSVIPNVDGVKAVTLGTCDDEQK